MEMIETNHCVNTGSGATLSGMEAAVSFEIDADEPARSADVPSFMLQPLVENSIKHGLTSKIEGGSIYMRSRVTESHLIIEVEDDGVGMGAANLLERPTGLGGTGIGMANVAERLKVLYGDTARMTIDSHEGKGTLVRLRLPILETAGAIPAAPSSGRRSGRTWISCNRADR